MRLLKQKIIALFLLIFFALSAFGVAAAKDFTQKIHPKLQKAKGAELVPIIIEYSDSMPDKKMLKELGCKQGHALKALRGISAECPADAISGIAGLAETKYVWEDELLFFSLDSSVPLINATQAWSDFGNGTGINISILDSGINKSHPALAGQVILENDFTPEGILDDRCNHGTPVACTVGCINETYTGVAPGSKLFNAKVGRVVNENPLQCGVSSSAAIAAIDWSIEHGAQVIHMSIGSGVSQCYQSALAVAVNNSGKNIVIVVSAGNGGPSSQSIWTPACAENALTVGASDGDTIADFSSRGPTDYGIEKPDVVAPGVGITAANKDGVSFSDYSGTSFSAPHVSGIAALMLEQKKLLPQEVKQILKMTAINLSYDINTQGSGRVDAWAAVNTSRGWVGHPLLTTSVAVPEATRGIPFVINATISNTGSADAEDVVAVLAVPDGIDVIGSAEQEIGLIRRGDSETISWTLNASVSGTYYANIMTSATGLDDVLTPFVIAVNPAKYSIVIQPNAVAGKDSYISSANPNTNYGTANPLKVQTNSLRALILWNLSGIPVNANISSAIMQLYVPSVQKTADNNVTVRRLVKQWCENNVTWNKYDGVNSWATAGGDYSSVVWASALVGSANKYYYWDITQLVKSLHNNTYPNYGIIMISLSNNNRKDFTSSDSPTASQRPVLLVNYTL
ncbi:MAG: S8 family serine peptidase [Candidatus Woesearchaeota archaeon]